MATRAKHTLLFAQSKGGEKEKNPACGRRVCDNQENQPFSFSTASFISAKCLSAEGASVTWTILPLLSMRKLTRRDMFLPAIPAAYASVILPSVSTSKGKFRLSLAINFLWLSASSRLTPSTATPFFFKSAMLSRKPHASLVQ